MNNARMLSNLLRSAPYESSGVLTPRPIDDRVSVMIRGRDDVGSMRPLLAALGRQTGQAGALDAVDVLIRAPSALRKTPFLVLVGVRPDLSLEWLTGAVLVYEYRVAGAPTGLFSTDDIFGERTVLAASEIRMEVAEEACRFLIERGALACLISVHAPPGDGLRAGCNVGCDMARRVRTKERDLLLADSFEQTLATLGRSTRHNLRRYKARVEEQFGAWFLPQACVTAEEMIELSRESMNPVPADVAVWRQRLAHAQPEAIVAGLRAANGQWLSLVGGYRQQDRAILEWQMNRAGLGQNSICTAMRSFLVEHEIARGTRRISFQGGTRQTLGLWLHAAEFTDVIAVRRGLRGEALRRLAYLIFPESNFLGRALGDPQVEWSTTVPIAA